MLAMKDLDKMYGLDEPLENDDDEDEDDEEERSDPRRDPYTKAKSIKMKH